MAQLTTDTAILAKEAGNFERIASELRGVIAHVESIAGALQGGWHGQTGVSAQAALARFHEAATAQQQQLDDISSNLHSAGAHYTSTDQEQAGSLGSAPGLDGSSASVHAASAQPQSLADAMNLGGLVGSPGHATVGALQPAGVANGSLGGATGTPMQMSPPSGQVRPQAATTAARTPQIMSNATAGEGKVMFSDYTTGDGQKIPSPPPEPPTVIDASPPDDPAKHHCGPGEIAKDTLIGVGGAAGIGSGLAGEVPTLGGSSALILGSAGALWDSIDKLSECE